MAFAPDDSNYLLTAADSDLTNYHVMTAGLGLIFTPGPSQGNSVAAVTGNLALLANATTSGYFVYDQAGNFLRSRTFQSTATITVVNGSGVSGDTTFSTVAGASNQKVGLQIEGDIIGIRKTLNFIGAGGISVTAVDNDGNDRVDISVTAGGSGGSAPDDAVYYLGTANVGLPEAYALDDLNYSGEDQGVLLSNSDGSPALLPLIKDTTPYMLAIIDDVFVCRSLPLSASLGGSGVDEIQKGGMLYAADNIPAQTNIMSVLVNPAGKAYLYFNEGSELPVWNENPLAISLGGTGIATLPQKGEILASAVDDAYALIPPSVPNPGDVFVLIQDENLAFGWVLLPESSSGTVTSVTVTSANPDAGDIHNAGFTCSQNPITTAATLHIRLGTQVLYNPGDLNILIGGGPFGDGNLLANGQRVIAITPSELPLLGTNPGEAYDAVIIGVDTHENLVTANNFVSLGTRLGQSSLQVERSVLVGSYIGDSVLNIDDCTLIGSDICRQGLTIDKMTVIGSGAAQNAQGSLVDSCIFGYQAGYHATGTVQGFTSSTIIGVGAAPNNQTYAYNTLLGYQTDCTGGATNSTAIGANATVQLENQVQLGNGCSVAFGLVSPAPTTLASKIILYGLDGTANAHTQIVGPTDISSGQIATNSVDSSGYGTMPIGVNPTVDIAATNVSTAALKPMIFVSWVTTSGAATSITDHVPLFVDNVTDGVGFRVRANGTLAGTQEFCYWVVPQQEL